jgi:hypothetical protein
VERGVKKAEDADDNPDGGSAEGSTEAWNESMVIKEYV